MTDITIAQQITELGKENGLSVTFNKKRIEYFLAGTRSVFDLNVDQLSDDYFVELLKEGLQSDEHKQTAMHVLHALAETNYTLRQSEEDFIVQYKKNDATQDVLHKVIGRIIGIMGGLLTYIVGALIFTTGRDTIDPPLAITSIVIGAILVPTFAKFLSKDFNSKTRDERADNAYQRHSHKAKYDAAKVESFAKHCFKKNENGSHGLLFA